MKILAIGVIILYYYLFVLYYQRIFPPKKAKRVQAVAFILIVAYTYMFIYKINMTWIIMLTIIAIMTVSLRFTTEMNWLQASYGASICVISAYCFRGILMSILSFFFVAENLIHNDEIYYATTIVALPLSFLFFYILRVTVLPDDKLKVLLNNSVQLRYIVVYEMIAAINLTIINFGRVLSPDAIWYTEIALAASVLTIGMLIYSIYQSTTSIELLEYKLRAEILEEQFNRQLLHYKSYQKYTESFGKFKHDYKSLMTTLKTLIRAGENDRAIDLINDIYEDMNKNVQVHKRYSEDVVLDAILQDLANICEEGKIRFTFRVFSPKNTKLTLIDSIRVMSNITNNAIEACLKVPEEGRFIDVFCADYSRWVMLEVSNSYDGQVNVSNGKLTTTKSDKYTHGFGLNIVKGIVEGLGGFVLYDIDSKKKVFKIKIHIPKAYD